jgi:hypothetical protein
MSDSKQLSARQAALAVLAKAKEVLKESSLMKAEYKTENDPKPGIKYGKLETNQKPLERDYSEYEVKKPSFKDSSGKRLERQVSPSKNPAEEAEGNNKPDGMEPRYEFKDKVSKELAKEKAAHMDKAENPDKEADAELGEKVEHDVEEHHKEMDSEVDKEGHDTMAKPKDKAEGQTESAIIPRLIGSAKLSKFMEHMHSKRKNAQAQSAEAVGHDGPDAPPARSTQAGQPDMNKKYEGFKAVESSAAKSGASDPAAVAAAAGRKKYGKEAFQHAAAAGKKMGKK